ncbi:MAG: hypothetical protein KDG54_02370, partial [Geminicoccaceae bacterium]|nr:hypothetical protein [Geminicoccaceae bacterium]
MTTNACLLISNEIYREGLKRILLANDFEVDSVTRTADLLESGKLDPDMLYIIDSAEPQDASKVISQLLERDTSIKVIMLAEEFQARPMLECFKAGAF